jgi:cytochrome c5
MKNIHIVVALLAIVFCSAVLYSCKTPASIAGKSGVQLWSENCQRCHNIPAPTTYNKETWDLVGTHMGIRANLTAMEKDKIVEFLKSAN